MSVVQVARRWDGICSREPVRRLGPVLPGARHYEAGHYEALNQMHIYPNLALALEPVQKS